ncbi:MAG: succinate dehydrogenase, hydrophobic membrane anchor protein [Burkholderiales bacterium]
MVNRPPAGAHHALRDWLGQRMTAVIMVLYTFFFIGLLLAGTPLDYARWKGLFATHTMRIATLIFLFSMFFHAWVGMHDIFMDYIKPTGVRLALQALVIVALLAYTVWSIKILWGA